MMLVHAQDASTGTVQLSPLAPQPPPSALTDEQLQALSNLRADLEAGGHLKPDDSFGSDDATLVRFLRARKFDLELTKRMVTQCLQWRHQVEGVGIDTLYRQIDPLNYPNREKVFQYWPMYFHRTDKLGRPINIQRFGGLDLSGLYSVMDRDTHLKTLIVNCEVLTREILPACTHKKLLDRLEASCSSSLPFTEKVTNAFCIIDLKGFSLSQFWSIKGIARACFKISQDYYPETMGYLAIINAPKSFSTIFKAVQGWLSKDTISKINVLGDDYQSTLLEYIDAENLPSCLGGKCDCDPNNLWMCSKNDPNLDRSPWLKGRDWKNQSWNKFREPSSTLSTAADHPIGR